MTVFAGEAPHGISDHASNTARSLAGSLGWSMCGLWNIKHFPLYSHTMIVIGPEHARTFGDDGWSKADLTRHLFETVRVPYRTLLPDEDNGEGTNVSEMTEEAITNAIIRVSKATKKTVCFLDGHGEAVADERDAHGEAEHIGEER